MNKENQDMAGSQSGLSCESVPRRLPFWAADKTDRRFVWIYFILGYFFIYTFTSGDFDAWFSAFAALYVTAVLVYVSVKGSKLSKEAWFWTGAVLATGLPYGLWSVMPGPQALAFIMTAAYWTLAVNGCLLDNGKTSQWVMFDMWNALFVVPFYNFLCHGRVLLGITGGNTEGETQDGNKSEKEENTLGQGNRRVLYVGLGLVISLPVLVIVIPLLSNADAGFQKLMMNSGMYIEKHFLFTFVRFILSLPVTFYLFGLVFGGFYRRNTDRIDKKRILSMEESVRVVPDAAMYTALIVVCTVYLLFIGLQGKYLFSAFAGIRPEGFTYAEYARRGFFELCQTAALNLFLLLGANIFSRTQSDKNRGLLWLNVLLSVLTLLLITTAMSKMGMYIAAYGLTVKRILTMVFMIWMALVFILVIARQWKAFPLTRICVLTGVVMFCLLCVLPVGQMIDAYNQWRF